MPLFLTRRQYAEMFGPTTGDRVRLGDTELFIEVERDLIAEQGGYGNEVKFGGGKGQSPLAHRAEVLASEHCGCFYCLSIFDPKEIQEWVDEIDDTSTTALCPRCDVDSVIGNRSGCPITIDFLEKMHRYSW